MSSKRRRTGPQGTKIRVDQRLIDEGLATELKEARGLVMAGVVLSAAPGEAPVVVSTPGTLVAASVVITVRGRRRYVSRGGEKLEGALDDLAFEVEGLVAADLGISTGGFTHCLLERGAIRVYGVDVAYGTVAWQIRNDPRVKLYERTNARLLTPDFFGERVDLVVIDASFISLERLLSPAKAQLASDGHLLALVKPQFEVPKAHAEGGVVTDDTWRRWAVEKVVTAGKMIGLEMQTHVDSRVPGPDGNREIFILFRNQELAPPTQTESFERP
jgi:23S rRNA (cytidine1920-2'-O)/16S rRNA (cytidine1409-2'-O)-methyltransferase